MLPEAQVNDLFGHSWSKPHHLEEKQTANHIKKAEPEECEWQFWRSPQLNTQHPQRRTPHLQRGVPALGGHTLHGLVVAAASAAFQHHAGRDVHVLRVLWVLLENVHQQVPGLAHALHVNVGESNNYKREEQAQIFQFNKLRLQAGSQNWDICNIWNREDANCVKNGGKKILIKSSEVKW